MRRYDWGPELYMYSFTSFTSGTRVSAKLRPLCRSPNALVLETIAAFILPQTTFHGATPPPPGVRVSENLKSNATATQAGPVPVLG